ncbi:YkgJ family cysteine cluster protein [Vibrio makurazakiensis]|uniref:YkgJ family cysteine cluster protein n=1 Tax=Vibrio makurazakiensis TaxID=2910250 RepID=UPI003D0F4F03
MDCRLGCGACCIAPSISSSFPLHPQGKKAGERCKQLNNDNLCKLFGKPERPDVCHNFKAADWVCGTTSTQAINILTDLETCTQ